MNEQRAIAKLLSRAEAGEVFVPSDFAEAGSPDSVRKALSRLVKAGELERPMRVSIASRNGALSWIRKCPLTLLTRLEERRVGKESRSRWSPYH